MKPRKPASRKHVVVRCDGSKVTWRERWAWWIDRCEECGHVYRGTGRWEQVAVEAAHHVGEFVLDHDDTFHRPQDSHRDSPYFGLIMGPGTWRCCGKRFDGRMPGVNAVIRDIQDPQEVADA